MGLVDRAGHWSNDHYLTEIIKVYLIPRIVESAKIVQMYLERGLTARQVATELGTSKAFVLSRLNEAGINASVIKYMNLSSPRPRPASHAPYGHKVVNGRLVENKSEMSIARKIVEMRQRQKLSWKTIAAKLNAKGFANRSGEPWQVGFAKAVFDRWKDKI